MKRPLFLALALVASTAWAEVRTDLTLRELAPGVGAVALQQGEALLLEADGHPDEVPTRLPAGWFYTETGHHRLTLALAQLQADKLAAEARADALAQALSLQQPPPSSRLGTGAVVGLVLLFAVGVGTGYALARSTLR